MDMYEKYDEDRFKVVKEDIDTLLVFVSHTIIVFSAFQILMPLIGRSILSCSNCFSH